MKEVSQLLPRHLPVYFPGPQLGLLGFPEGQGFSLPGLADLVGTNANG